MIPYQEIPLDIKESPEINSLRRFVRMWQGQKILSEYIEAYRVGVKMIVELQQQNPGFMPSRRQLILTASYYVLRKEFFKRMSPLVSKRSDDVIMLDNKKLLDKFDACLFSGGEKNAWKIRRYTKEICSRME